MVSKEPLGIYLNDHLAGSVGALELIRNSMSENEGTPLGAFLESLLPDLEADSESLKALMTRLEIKPQPVKQAGAWVMEKLTRLKLENPITGNQGVAKLLALETLSMGIEGKLRLWQSLKEVASDDACFSETELDSLVQRAEQQLEALETHRLAAAARAFRA
ncbi:MAG: hypothetical protein DLM67_15785 [Candidatus Nephthysia bennettiae]|uniref:Uncharacterized protein n=1 Tax=Candidatus Nephthysia bennettiae TaxID=3127016 RepID=A0A934KE37_9BACT|nr:hypothetical protein [Candidatus Dormibacteraeota bacterium]MBJ7611384.1 hypothetical protein [Candidatus Dormibacteraeota bacterium]PZR91853.1 MAG: hypothetical protein DLM67_15785 [Candidatus Dormibacteraeota bacterium]